MKRIILASLIVLCIGLIGCSPEILNTTSKTDTVFIERVEYEEEYESTTYMMIGEVNMPITDIEPEAYNRYIRHDNHTHTLNNKDIYNYSKDRINKDVNAEITEYEYDNGTYRHVLIRLFD